MCVFFLTLKYKQVTVTKVITIRYIKADVPYSRVIRQPYQQKQPPHIIVQYTLRYSHSTHSLPCGYRVSDIVNRIEYRIAYLIKPKKIRDLIRITYLTLQQFDY